MINNANHITVIDSIMGSGKTTWAINYMKKRTDKKFLYITPYLDECQRIQDALPERYFTMPVKNWPKLTKLRDISGLLNDERNIAASHELFKRFNDDIKEILLYNSQKYILIIDEILDIIAPQQIKTEDVKTLTESKIIEIDNNGICHWNPEYDSGLSRYEDIRQLASANNLICVNKKFFLWKYNPEIFKFFNEIYIMTYLFDGSILRGYFDYYNISYTKVTLDINKQLVSYAPQNTAIYQSLINIYEGKLNNGFTISSMSKNWYSEISKNRNQIKQLRNNTYNYFRNILKAKPKTVLWSTFSDMRNLIEYSRYKNGFIACNARATNEYGDRYNLAYLVNLYIHPGVAHFLNQKDIVVDRDQYALGIMLQWIWRSRIRNGEPINIYIPSLRMRKLLKEWMDIADED